MASMPYAAMSGAHDGGWGAAAASKSAMGSWCTSGMAGASGFEQLGGQLSGQLGSLLPSQSYNMAAAHASFNAASVSSPSIPTSSPDKPLAQAATSSASSAAVAAAAAAAAVHTSNSSIHTSSAHHTQTAAVHAAHAVASSYPSYFSQFADPTSLMCGRVH